MLVYGGSNSEAKELLGLNDQEDGCSGCLWKLTTYGRVFYMQLSSSTWIH